MSTALDAILAYKRAEVDRLLSAHSLERLRDAALAATAGPPPRGFERAIAQAHALGHNALICELKRRSPSAGDILPGADPTDIARQYEAGGAACLSVLTDGPSFGGNLLDLSHVRDSVSLPVLRKDFMIDAAQIFETRAAGADAILVIMAAVGDDLAAELVATATGLALDVLVEVHDEAELQRALRLPVRLIGVNNRNLKTMVTDLATTERLAPLVPADRILVSESGVRTGDDIRRLNRSGARTFLIGESLMKSPKRAELVHSLRTGRTD